MTLQTISTIPSAKSEFESKASGVTPKKKRRSALSVRMSDEQWDQFKRDAVGMSLNAYAISCFFDKGSSKSKGRQTKRDKAVVAALRRMGSLGLGTFIACQILAYEEGRLHLSNQEIAELRQADIEFHRLRCDLVQALGMKSDYKK